MNESLPVEQIKRQNMIFCNLIYQKIIDGVKLNKRDTERFASQYGIEDKNAIKELCELAIVYRARMLAQADESLWKRFRDIVQLYHSQVNLSHRTSQSVMLQQYSTPAPIAFLAGSFVSENGNGLGSVKRGGRFTKNHFQIPQTRQSIPTSPLYFEPSAGNGLLTIAMLPQQVWVNEIDEFRSINLAEQGFAKQLKQDATESFDMPKKFDGIITNPPFGRLDKALVVDDFPINTLDHAMAIRALDCMKDDGRAAIIIGGHTEWDSAGRIKAGKNRIFFSYLYRHYHVADVINVDGDLYSRQGTSFNIRMIFINGRKTKPDGYPPLKSDDDKVVNDFEALYDRVVRMMPKGYNNAENNNHLRIIRAKAASKLKLLELINIPE